MTKFTPEQLKRVAEVKDLIKRTDEHLEYYEAIKNFSMVRYLERINVQLKQTQSAESDDNG